jgi:DtxR family Mn-dependent transcriptional regulator
MQISEAAQEILEKLWTDTVEGKNEFIELKDLGSEDIIKELLKSKYIIISQNRVQLTKPQGHREAQKIIVRHRLAERLLHDVLEVGKDDLEVSACKFEHIISEGIEERICTLLGHPTVCPHGKRIPPSRCCKEGKEIAEKVVSSLSKLRRGQHGKIVYVLSKNHKNLQKLLGMGVLPGMPIEVIQTYPSYVFQIGLTQIAVDAEIANDIFVRFV